MFYLAGHAVRDAGVAFPGTGAPCQTCHPRNAPAPAVGAGAAGHAPAHPGGTYMFSISTSPKPEHDTCVAPSIRRAKSYVTRFC